MRSSTRVLSQKLLNKSVRGPEVGGCEPRQCRSKIQQFALARGPKDTERSSVGNGTAIGFLATGSVVDEQQDIGFVLCQKNRSALTRVDLLQGGIVRVSASVSYFHPLGEGLYPLPPCCGARASVSSARTSEGTRTLPYKRCSTSIWPISTR